MIADLSNSNKLEKFIRFLVLELIIQIPVLTEGNEIIRTTEVLIKIMMMAVLTKMKVVTFLVMMETLITIINRNDLTSHPSEFSKFVEIPLPVFLCREEHLYGHCPRVLADMGMAQDRNLKGNIEQIMDMVQDQVDDV